MPSAKSRSRMVAADMGFSVTLILLCGIGLTTLYFASSLSADRFFGDPFYYVKRQVLIGIIGFVAMQLISNVNLDLVRNAFFPMALFAAFLCFLTILPGIGIEKNGARRWIGLGPLSFQPAELAKFVIVCYFASVFDRLSEKIQSNALVAMPALIVLIGFVFLIYFQNDFSSTIFIFFIGLVMFYFAGIKFRIFLAIFLTAIPLAFIFIFSEPYRVNRIISYLRPKLDPFGLNYQMLAAQNAIHSSGFWGHGIGGLLRRNSIIPEIQSDFIFAGWTEEAGFFGVIVYFALLCYMFWCGFQISLECEDRFRSLLVIGASSAVFFQSVLNTGVVSGAFPSTGIPLPFFSAGGTSFAITLSLCGLVMNVSKWNLRVKYDYN